MAVTAVDVITALGDDLASTFDAIDRGEHGFTRVRRFDVSTARNSRAALLANGALPHVLVERLAQRLAAARGAIEIDRAYYSGTPDESAPPRPAGFRSSGDHGFDWDRVYTSACVSSSSALIDAASVIASGEARRVLVVAARSIDEGTFHLFSSGGVMTSDTIPRPLTQARSGMLLGDGAAIFLLEAEDALDPDAESPKVQISGWGRAGDGFDSYRPDPAGSGMTTAIYAALQSAGVTPNDIDHVSLHGTGTLLGDASEYAALTKVFGANTVPPCYGPKASVGHMLEATGLVEAALTASSITRGVLPRSGGVRAKDVLMFTSVLRRSERVRVDHALSINLAFGGSNTAVVLSAWNTSRPLGTAPPVRRHIGVLAARTDALEPSAPLQRFITSDYPPAIFEAARRCLRAADLSSATRDRTAVLLLSPRGDEASRRTVISRLEAGRRLPPALLVQGTPTSVVGLVARDYGLHGSITALSTTAEIDDPAVTRAAHDIAGAEAAHAVLVLRFAQPDPTSPGTGEALIMRFR